MTHDLHTGELSRATGRTGRADPPRLSQPQGARGPAAGRPASARVQGRGWRGSPLLVQPDHLLELRERLRQPFLERLPLVRGGRLELLEELLELLELLLGLGRRLAAEALDLVLDLGQRL